MWKEIKQTNSLIRGVSHVNSWLKHLFHTLTNGRVHKNGYQTQIIALPNLEVIFSENKVHAVVMDFCKSL